MRVGIIVGATVLGLVCLSPPVQSETNVELTATALMMRGINATTLDEGIMNDVLHGRFRQDTKVPVEWPGSLWPNSGSSTITLGQSVAVGTENFLNAIQSTPGEVVAGGMSGSSLVIDEVLRRLAAENNPRADELSFVVVGDANRSMFAGLAGIPLPILDYTVPAIPETPYNVTVVAAEYDGYSDFPDRRWNLLAVANALAGTGVFPGFGSVHYDSIWADLSNLPAKNVTTTVNSQGGVTTTYLIPTADLPLLRPLRAMGVSQQDIDKLTAVLRPIVDSAYVRSDPVPLVSHGHLRQSSSSTTSARSAQAAKSAPSKTRATRPNSAPSTNHGGHSAAAGGTGRKQASAGAGPAS